MRAVMVTAGLVLALATWRAAPAQAQARRSESTARALSAGGILLPPLLLYGGFQAGEHKQPALAVGLITLGLAAIEIGPAAGHWYAGNYWTTGMTVRGVGLLAVGIGIPAAVGGFCFGLRSSSRCRGSDDQLIGGLLLSATGLIAIVVGAGLDLARADDAARDYNDDARTRVRALAYGGRF